MFKKRALAVAVALGFGLAGAAAQASTFTFNPTGGGAGAGAVAGVSTLDEKPGNVLAIGGAGLLVPGQQITDLYQANLNTLDSANGDTLYTSGSDGNFFTFVAGFGEFVKAVDPITGTVTFALDPLNTTNFFFICAHAANGNNLAGTGFACDDPILTGHAVHLDASQTIQPGTGALDQNGTNNRSPTQTVNSTGATDLTVQIDTVNAGYFPDLDPLTTLIFSFTNTSQVTPFKQVDPSFNFSSDGHANGNLPDNIGPINGISGPNFQFQADANTSIAVPEPGTLALLGLTLGGLALVRRRRDNA